MGWRKVCLTSAKKYFQTASRLSGGPPTHRRVDVRLFSSPSELGGRPAGVQRGWQQAGGPGGSRALVTGLEGRAGPPSLSRQGSSEHCLGVLEMLAHSQPGAGNLEPQPRCKLATEESQVNHEVGKAGPLTLLLQRHGLHRAEQAN